MTFSASVRFVPWIGSSYEKGHQGVKTLILGESHYRKDGKAYSRELNIELIHGQVTQEGKYAAPYPFWTKIVRLLSPNDTDPQHFWNTVAFYNYVQEFVGATACERPTLNMWAEAEQPFFEVLGKLRPSLIVVLGAGLWNSLPCRQCTDIDGESPSFYCKYRLDEPDLDTVATRVNHPSSYGFEYDKWIKQVNHGRKIAIQVQTG